jgi:hypothetical protein
MPFTHTAQVPVADLPIRLANGQMAEVIDGEIAIGFDVDGEIDYDGRYHMTIDGPVPYGSHWLELLLSGDQDETVIRIVAKDRDPIIDAFVTEHLDHFKDEAYDVLYSR